MKRCGCRDMGDGSFELCAKHEEEHRHGGLKSCRRCGDRELADKLVERLCPRCMKDAHLLKCDVCGRAVAESITVKREHGPGYDVVCKVCQRMDERRKV